MMRTAVSGPGGTAPRRPVGTRLAHPDRHRVVVRKGGFVDHTVYDTTSILQFLSKRFGLELFAGNSDPIAISACIRFRRVRAAAPQQIYSVAVGTPITGRPPHRSVRAAFPHTPPRYWANSGSRSSNGRRSRDAWISSIIPARRSSIR